MIAVLFEAWPNEGQEDVYFDMAARLRPDLDGVDGFISIERFRSVSDAGKILSLSWWRDEEALTVWRNLKSHRTTQAAGRRHVFRDYRLRVGGIDRDYGMFDRDHAPVDSQTLHGCSASALTAL